ncbi:sialic acid-binding Ig-like lectin 14 [Discoglossus pictus]
MWFGRYWRHQKYLETLMLFFLLLWNRLFSENVPGFQIQIPTTIIVQNGLCVHIPCTFTIPNFYILSTSVQGLWYKNKEKLKVNADQRTFFKKRERTTVNTDYTSDVLVISNTSGRFLLTGDLQKGDCSLRINDVQKEDQGYYRFRVEDHNLKFTFLNVEPFLQVKDLTEPPEISPIKNLIAGEEVSLTCIPPGRCTGSMPLFFTWEGSVIKEETDISYRQFGNRTSKVIFTPSEKDHNSSLTCKVIYRNQVSTSKTIILSVTSHDSQPPTHINEIPGQATDRVYQDLKIPTNEVYSTITI